MIPRTATFPPLDRRRALGALALALSLAAAIPADALDFSLAGAATRPTDLPAWLAPLLPAEGVEIAGSDGPLARFWIRSDLPATQPIPPTGERGVQFGRFPIGALIGVVELLADWSDYRTQPIPAGRYTLRYGIQPANREHTGQTYFRDFLLLVPLDADSFDPEGDDLLSVVRESRRAGGATHPAVMALYQIYEQVDTLRVMENDFGDPSLAVPLGDSVMGIVLEGQGQHVM
ncbi:MAG TPA: hypothetical protein VMV46_03725 [Thermoanaerobaculia bacterium]|nr:hypothetical protein [Thermoanaerobaculia bacterium]